MDSTAATLTPEITAAAADWNNTLQASGSTKRLVSTTGDVVHIMIDDTVCATARASTQVQFRTMRICSTVVALALTNPGYLARLLRHEFGRMLGLGPSVCDPATTVMTQVEPEDMNHSTSVLGSADNCYTQAHLRDPEPEPDPGGGGDQYYEPDGCQRLINEGYLLQGHYYPGPCMGDSQTEYSIGDCCIDTGSPLVISLSSDPVSFSSAEDGVPFDFYALGRRVRVAWPDSPDTAWLAADRNGNGVIEVVSR